MLHLSSCKKILCVNKGSAYFFEEKTCLLTAHKNNLQPVPEKLLLEVDTALVDRVMCQEWARFHSFLCSEFEQIGSTYVVHLLPSTCYVEMVSAFHDQLTVHCGQRPWQNRISILQFFRLKVQVSMYRNTLDILQVKST